MVGESATPRFGHSEIRWLRDSVTPRFGDCEIRWLRDSETPRFGNSKIRRLQFCDCEIRWARVLNLTLVLCSIPGALILEVSACAISAPDLIIRDGSRKLLVGVWHDYRQWNKYSHVWHDICCTNLLYKKCKFSSLWGGGMHPWGHPFSLLGSLIKPSLISVKKVLHFLHLPSQEIISDLVTPPPPSFTCYATGLVWRIKSQHKFRC